MSKIIGVLLVIGSVIGTVACIAKDYFFHNIVVYYIDFFVYWECIVVKYWWVIGITGTTGRVFFGRGTSIYSSITDIDFYVGGSCWSSTKFIAFTT